MLDGLSAPPRLSATPWSITYPEQGPEVLPLAGQGWERRKALVAALLRLMCPRLSLVQVTQELENRRAVEILRAAAKYREALERLARE
jgi:hypothetical protein